VDGPEGPQQLLMGLSLELVKNRDLMAEFRCKIDEKIMKKFRLGKFRTNIVGSSPATNEVSEVWIDKLRSWADEIGLQDLKWEVQPRNRDGGFWTGFPRDAKRIRELEVLNIQSLGLTYLPKEIGNLTRLRKLWARENKLTKIPNEIGNLVLLEEIDFEGNQITAIPDSIGKLKQLRDLDLRSNQLNYVPVSVSNLEMLEKFDLRDQPINLDHIQTPLTDDQVRAICSLGDVVRW
jgi:Leucine-rich repeat (LRR) protein